MNELRYVSGDNRPIFIKILELYDDNGNKLTNYSGISAVLTAKDKSGNIVFQSTGILLDASSGLIKFPMQSSYTANIKGELFADIEISLGTSKTTAMFGNTNLLRIIILEDIT